MVYNGHKYEDLIRGLIAYIGDDPQREGLKDTPRRVLAGWGEWSQGYSQDVGDYLTEFEDGAQKYDEMVLVRDIPIYSHCEHHLAPFFGVAHIGYIPNGKLLGLSKFARVANVFARRLQVQERLTSQIANALFDALAPKGVGVVIECRHLCLESRGVRTPGSLTTTSCLLGVFQSKPEARAEFLGLTR